MLISPGAQMERLIRIGEVIELCGLSRSSIWRLERRGQFPSRRKLAIRAVGWKRSELEVWLNSRAQANQQRPPMNNTSNEGSITHE